MDKDWRRQPAPGTKFDWPWPGKQAGDIQDEQISAFLRSRHLDYPIGASRQELLDALAAAGYEIPS